MNFDCENKFERNSSKTQKFVEKSPELHKTFIDRQDDFHISVIYSIKIILYEKVIFFIFFRFLVAHAIYQITHDLER